MLVVGQCVQGYVTAKALIQANNALDVVAGLFWPTFKFPKELRVDAVPLAGDVLNRRHREYLEDLTNVFVSKGLMLVLVGAAHAEENVEPWIEFDGEVCRLVSSVFFSLSIFSERRRKRQRPVQWLSN